MNKVTELLQESQSEKDAIENKQKRLQDESIEHGNTIYQLESERDEIKLKFEGKKRECERMVMELSKLNQVVTVFKNKNCKKYKEQEPLQEAKYKKDRISFLPTINCEEDALDPKIFLSKINNKNKDDITDTQKEKSIHSLTKPETFPFVHLKEQSCDVLPSTSENTVPNKGTEEFPLIKNNDPKVNIDSFHIPNELRKENNEGDDEFAETSNWPP